MNLYLDTSALVKLYVVEPFGDQVVDATVEATQVCTSSIAYVETRAALARRLREAKLNNAEHAETVSVLDSAWPTFTRMNVSSALVYRAGDLAQEYGLRGYDTVHLATALAFQRRYGDVRFLAFDQRLIDASRRANLAIYGD